MAQQTAPPDEQVLRLVTANMPRSLDPANIDAQRIINNGFAEPLVFESLDGSRIRHSPSVISWLCMIAGSINAHRDMSLLLDARIQ
jgi:hypothetical protein